MFFQGNMPMSANGKSTHLTNPDDEDSSKQKKLLTYNYSYRDQIHSRRLFCGRRISIRGSLAFLVHQLPFIGFRRKQRFS